MYAYIDYKIWRCINSADEANPGELVGDELPQPSEVEKFSDYCQTIADGVSSWLSKYVNETFGYDDIVSAASYAGDKDPKFSAEGTAARDWRSDVFKSLYAAIPAYSIMSPDKWPDLSYITANLPQPSAYNWEPSNEP